MMKRTTGPLLAAALAGFLGACNNSPTTPSSSTDYTSATRFFSGVLEPSGTSGALTFTTVVSDTVSVALVSLTDGAGAPAPDQLTLNVGTVSGADCVPTNTSASKVVGTTLTAAVTVTLPAGAYCISLADAGQLTAPKNFTIRVVTSTGTAPAGTEGTDQMPLTLARHGASAKTFNATAQGVVSLTLATVAGDVVLPVELALGVWDGGACRVHASVVVVGGTDPQIAMLVDAGTYCVRLTDVGYLTGQVAISGTMQHP